jgi:hypothetical protein
VLGTVYVSWASSGRRPWPSSFPKFAHSMVWKSDLDAYRPRHVHCFLCTLVSHDLTGLYVGLVCMLQHCGIRTFLPAFVS